jgi:hypothetical protein
VWLLRPLIHEFLVVLEIAAPEFATICVTNW